MQNNKRIKQTNYAEKYSITPLRHECSLFQLYEDIDATGVLENVLSSKELDRQLGIIPIKSHDFSEHLLKFWCFPLIKDKHLMESKVF